MCSKQGKRFCRAHGTQLLAVELGWYGRQLTQGHYITAILTGQIWQNPSRQPSVMQPHGREFHPTEGSKMPRGLGWGRRLIKSSRFSLYCSLPPCYLLFILRLNYPHRTSHTVSLKLKMKWTIFWDESQLLNTSQDAQASQAGNEHWCISLKLGHWFSADRGKNFPYSISNTMFLLVVPAPGIHQTRGCSRDQASPQKQDASPGILFLIS